MELCPLGKTEIKITPIGLGTWQFSGKKSFHRFVWDEVGQEMADSIVGASIKRGINWYDTAELYGNGRSERVLAAALKRLNMPDNDVVIATKWNPTLKRAKSILKSFPEREKNLSPYSIDLHQIHNPFSISKTETQLNFMAKLVQDGKIKAVGISNFLTKKMEQAISTLDRFDIPLASNQMHYSLAYRKIESNGVMDMAKEHGVTIIAYSPLEQGLLTGQYHKSKFIVNSKPFLRRRLLKKKLKHAQTLLSELEAVATEINAPVPSVALRWVIQFHGSTVVAIPGATRPNQVETNALAMNIELSSEQMNALDDASQNFL